MLENALPNIEFELNDAHALMLSCLELVIYDYTQTHKPQKSSVKQSNLIPVYNPADVFMFSNISKNTGMYTDKNAHSSHIHNSPKPEQPKCPSAVK